MGADALPFGESLDSIAYKARLWNLEETVATFSTTFGLSGRRGSAENAENEWIECRRTDVAHLLLRQVR